MVCLVDAAIPIFPDVFREWRGDSKTAHIKPGPIELISHLEAGGLYEKNERDPQGIPLRERTGTDGIRW